MTAIPDIAFDQLLEQLKRQGFTLTPSDYIEFTGLFHRFNGTREELKYHLAPILCRNREEQLKFYALYDRYSTPPAQPKSKKPIDTNPYLTEKSVNRFMRRATRQVSFWFFIATLLVSGLRLVPLLWRHHQDLTIKVPLNADSIHIDRDSIQKTARPHRVFVVKKTHPSKSSPEEKSAIQAQGQPIEKENTVHSSAFAWLFILGLTCLLLSVTFFPLRRSKALPHVDINRLEGDDSPIDIPFMPKNHLIQNLPILARVARDLVQPIPTEIYRLEIDKTIRESIRAYGLPTPVYENIERRPEYLLLIDRSQALSSSLYRYLARTLAGYSVPIDYYYYDAHYAYFAEGSVRSIKPYSLRQRHGDAQVIDFQASSHPEFQDPEIPEPLLDAFDFYSPVYSTDPVFLREYLNDEDLFQWLCAAAVYPTVRWEVLLVVGAAVLKERSALSKLNFISLLKLVHIHALSGATIPTTLRLELLKNLGLREELATRKAILGLLEESDDLITADSPAFEEKRLQLYTQCFILFANDPRRNKVHEAEARKFMDIWDRRRAPDLATVLYLTNPNREWDTPVRSVDKPDQNVGVNKFIQELLALRVIHDPRIRSFFRNAAYSLFFILLLLFLFKDEVQPTGLNKAIGLVDRDYPDGPLSVAIPINDCLRQMLTGHRLLVTLQNYDNNQYAQLIDLDTIKEFVKITFGRITMAGKDPKQPTFQLILNKELTIDCPYKEYYPSYTLQLKGVDCDAHLPGITPPIPKGPSL